MGGSAKGTPFESPVRRAGLKMRPTPPCQRYGIRTLGTNPGPSARRAQGGRMNPSALRQAIESGTFGAMVPVHSSEGYSITLGRDYDEPKTQRIIGNIKVAFRDI